MLLGLLLQAPALGETGRLQFNLPPQPLVEALETLTAQAKIQMFYSAETVHGKTTPGLAGRYTLEQAISKLLEGTGLQYEFTAARAVAIKNPQRLAANDAADPNKAEENEAEPTVLPEMTVTASPTDETSYNAYSATTATKTNTPIMETPVSIQVVPKAVLQDQKVTRIAEALENVSGVRSDAYLDRGNRFNIRGFSNDNRIYRNGLGLIGGFGGFNDEIDSTNVESIEVLKGPAAVLYGRIEPGGLINVNTKRPLAEPYYALEQQYGSYDFVRTVWDATGPITSDQSLLYRFVGAYQNSDSFRDFSFTDRVLVNPSLTWRPTEATSFTVDVQGMNQDYKADLGIPVIGDRPAPIPISRSLDDPNTPPANDSHVLLGTDLTHNINDSWTLRNRFLATFADNIATWVNPVPYQGEALRDDGRTLDRNIFIQDGDTEAYTTNLDLTGRFSLWQTRHEILVGFDYTLGYSTYRSRGDFINPNPALAIDIFNPEPSYGIDPELFRQALLRPTSPGRNFSLAKQEWWGVYFQDHITLWDKLHILGGGRYDWAETGRGRGPSFDAAEDHLPSVIRKDDDFSPRVGVLYQVLPWMSVYSNWTTSLGANNGISASGEPFPPQRGEQYEAGLKSEVFDQRLSTTLVFYHLTMQNLLTPDLSTPDPTDRAAIGEARSQGIEFDLTGQITESVSLIGSYAFTDTRVTKDNAGLQGNQLYNAPEHAGSLWLKYDFKDYRPLNGLSLGFGAYVVGDRQGDAGNTFLLPGYVRLDAFAAYRWKVGPSRVTAQFNIRNLLDEDYYASTDLDGGRLGVHPGAPLAAIGSVRVEF